MNVKESVHRFLLLPNHVAIVLLLEFLNSFRSFGLRFVLYNYITNEFGISDTHAGAILGVKSLVDIAFGLSGSILVDGFGVRRVSLAALSVALMGRTLMAFGRSQRTLYAALFLFSPCGDALLTIGLYRVALKKLSTPLTRPLAFGMSYAMLNMAGASVALSVDWMRRKAGDIHIDGSWLGHSLVGGVYTPVRQFIVFTWVVLFLTLVVAYCFLEDWTVVDPADLDEEYRTPARGMKKRSSDIADGTSETITICEQREVNAGNEDDCNSLQRSIPSDAISAEPMVSGSILQRWFPQSFPAETEADEIHKLHTVDGVASRNIPRYKVFRTKYSKAGAGDASPCRGVVHLLKQLCFTMRMRSTWRVLAFSFASVPAAMQWTAGEIVLPPFLERRFGERIPIYTIQAIHMIGCLIFPPIAQAFTSAIEDFRVMLPGLWIMSLSPMLLARVPNVTGACMWQVVMTAGQVLWSPRQDSWTAGLAPTGLEGLFFAIASSRALLSPLGDVIMGKMNAIYNPNCLDCRDQYGHFCGDATSSLDAGDDGGSLLQCMSIQETCNIVLDGPQESCPLTCLDCPTYEPTNPSTFWYILVVCSITSPLLSWCFLPFLRGRHPREDACYGMCRASVNRFLGICGVPEDGSSCQIYSYIEEEAEDEEEEEEADTGSESNGIAIA